MKEIQTKKFKKENYYVGSSNVCTYVRGYEHLTNVSTYEAHVWILRKVIDNDFSLLLFPIRENYKGYYEEIDSLV